MKKRKGCYSIVNEFDKIKKMSFVSENLDS